MVDKVCPILPVRDIVIFPHVVVPLFVGREHSINALESAMKEDKQIVLLTQQNVQNDEPLFEELYHTGVLSNILQMLRLPDGTVKILIEDRTQNGPFKDIWDFAERLAVQFARPA